MSPKRILTGIGSAYLERVAELQAVLFRALFSFPSHTVWLQLQGEGWKKFNTNFFTSRKGKILHNYSWLNLIQLIVVNIVVGFLSFLRFLPMKFKWFLNLKKKGRPYPSPRQQSRELSLCLTWEKQESWSWGCECRWAGPEAVRAELAASFPSATLDEFARTVLESSPEWWRQREAGRLANPTTTQVQNQDYKVAQPSTHLISELLEHVKGWACRLKVTGSL